MILSFQTDVCLLQHDSQDNWGEPSLQATSHQQKFPYLRERLLSRGAAVRHGAPSLEGTAVSLIAEF